MFAFLKQNFRWIAGGFLLTYFSSFGQTFFVSASIAEWQAKFDLSHGEFGRLYMFATLASALCLPFVGRLVDVVPEHRSTISSLMMGFAWGVGGAVATHVGVEATPRGRAVAVAAHHRCPVLRAGDQR